QFAAGARPAVVEVFGPAVCSQGQLAADWGQRRWESTEGATGDAADSCGHWPSRSARHQSHNLVGFPGDLLDLRSHIGVSSNAARLQLRRVVSGRTAVAQPDSLAGALGFVAQSAHAASAKNGNRVA